MPTVTASDYRAGSYASLPIGIPANAVILLEAKVGHIYSQTM